MIVPTTPALTTHSRQVQQYLVDLFHNAPPEAWLVVSWLTDKREFLSRWFRIKDGKKATACIVAHAKHCNVYTPLGLRHAGCTGTQGRGTSEQVAALSGIGLDFDDQSGSHALHQLPSRSQLLAFLQALPFQCSLIIDSGGGLHVYLLFKELWILGTAEERKQASQLMRRVQRTVQHFAALQGWRVDPTANLSAVLRPVGTYNFKYDPPRLVTLVHEDPIRYNPSDILEAPWLAQVEDTYMPEKPKGTYPVTQFEPIVQGCAWLRHCRDDARSLPEPEWHAMLGIVVRCENGETIGHAWSQPYHTDTHQYSHSETQRKMQRVANDERAAFTCGYIAEQLQATAFCRACEHWGHIKSPLRLGEVRYDDPSDPLAGVPGGGFEHPHPNGVRAPATHSPRVSSADPERHAAWYTQDIQPYANKVGLVQANNTTIMTFLRNHSFWQSKFWWDDMANKPMYGEHAIDDHVVTEIGALFGTKHHLPISNDRLLLRCLAACCWQVRKDPLQDWLLALPGWDGVPRLETWLEACAGVTTSAYHYFVSRILIVSMIARAFDPGCLYRNVIVFEGPEEYRKSTFVANLVPCKPWHISLTSSFENKDVPMLIQGIWVAELSELDSLTRTEETRLKSFISETEDAYVPKWHLFRVAPKRRTIFVGTTNESSWLKSATGNTRFFPVKILHPMDVEYFVSIREQLFAEAMTVYGDNPRTWWELPTQAQEQAILEREERRQASVYESDLGVWLETRRFVEAQRQAVPVIPVPYETSWAEIATGFLRLDTPEKWKDMNLQKQVAHALKALGWHHKSTSRDGVRVRLWAKEPPLPF